MGKSKIKNQKSKIQFKIRDIEFYSISLISVFCVLISVGCSPLKKITKKTADVSGEIVKGIAGISTKVLEDGRKEAMVREFDLDYNKCYNKVEAALKNIGSYVYARDKKGKFIAVYVSQTDTTPVGVFLREIDSAHTQVEVSSPSTYAKELITNKICVALGKPEEAPEPGGMGNIIEEQPANSGAVDRGSSPLQRLRPEAE